jgi:heme exporter protein C
MKRALYLAAAAACIAGFAWTLYIIFYVTPIDRQLMFNQKIFYYHVANAFMLFAAVITCGVGSLLYLRTRKGKHDDLARAAAELSVLFGAVALVTGSIWGAAAWELWWTWDARQTTTLLLWMAMLGYVLVRQYGGPGSERMAAGLAVFATVNIPLVYFSVSIWRTYHPQTSVVPGLRGWLRISMWTSVALFTLMFVIMLIARMRVAQGERRLSELREQALDAGVIE